MTRAEAEASHRSKQALGKGVLYLQHGLRQSLARTSLNAIEYLTTQQQANPNVARQYPTHCHLPDGFTISSQSCYSPHFRISFRSKLVYLWGNAKHYNWLPHETSRLKHAHRSICYRYSDGLTSHADEKGASVILASRVLRNVAVTSKSSGIFGSS